jgi:uncharacterized protein YbgA (DUF1722 family)
VLARKLTNILSAFKGKDWKGFDRWMISPAHNTDAGLLNLARFYRDLAPAFAPENLKSEQQWRAIYPEGQLKEGVLRVKIRQLTRQVEDFLISQELEKDELLRSELLLRARRPALGYAAFEKETKSILNRLETQEVTGVRHFQQKVRLRSGLKQHPGFDAHPDSGNQLHLIDQDVDAVFALMKYGLRNELQSRRSILGESHDQRFFPAILEERAAGLLTDHPTATLYDKLQALLENEEVNLADLQEAFVQQFAHLPEADRVNIFYRVLNFLSRRINRGEESLIEKMLDWYRIGMETGVLLTEGIVSPTTFSNIALLGYRSGNTEWTDSFLENYGNYLEKGLREETLTASRGTGAFLRGEFEHAVELLKPLRSGRNLRLRTHLTVVRALYELMAKGEREYEELERIIANFESRLQRETHFSKGVLLPYLNHLRLLRRLAKIVVRPGNDTDARTRLSARVEGEEALMAKAWLLKKIREGQT